MMASQSASIPPSEQTNPRGPTEAARPTGKGENSAEKAQAASKVEEAKNPSPSKKEAKALQRAATKAEKKKA